MDPTIPSGDPEGPEGPGALVAAAWLFVIQGAIASAIYLSVKLIGC